MDLHHYRITGHARRQMAHRGITEELIACAMLAPERLERRGVGRVVAQAHVRTGVPARTYIVRVIVDVDRQPVEVVTAYLSTKLSKYAKSGDVP